MTTNVLSGIRANPLFDELVRRRRRLVACLTAAVLVPYYGFIFVAAFAPKLLSATVLGSIVNLGWPLGAALIVGSWLLTGLYTHRANGEFDELTAKILAGEKR